MSLFIRLLGDEDKETSLKQASNALRCSSEDERLFSLSAVEFERLPGAPFAYWSTQEQRQTFEKYDPFKSNGRTACVTNPAGDDTRYFRAWWEVKKSETDNLRWVPLSKGGSYSQYYFDLHLVVAWNPIRKTYLGFQGTRHRPLEKPASLVYFFRPGLTWPRRTGGLSFRVLPKGSIFADKGPGIFVEQDDESYLLAISAILNSAPFGELLALQLARTELAQSFEVGLVQQTPFPDLTSEFRALLASKARRIWQLKYLLSSFEEVSHAFVVPKKVYCSLVEFDEKQLQSELERLQLEIDEVAQTLFYSSDSLQPLEVYKLEEMDPFANLGSSGSCECEAGDDELSWLVGIAFGRFDKELIKGNRAPPRLPDPFSELPERSPGMTSIESNVASQPLGILVDDRGHSKDLVSIVESAALDLGLSIDHDLRKWIRSRFFPRHLREYSMSKRKAPVYWPLSTASGSYTLWVYYPNLDDQTLYTGINDFLEPKLKLIGDELNSLRAKSSRSAAEERELEKQQDLEQELIELRDLILEFAPNYKPNHDDGVQITAAPLWPLFRHKPWQKVLKDTWEKLEAGEYDWAHLAYSYWPERVREKCKTDKSLAIAHGLEELYEEPAT